MTDRAQRLARLRSTPNWPVLVVGGGINGAGTFRDLALQGVDCLIVDKEDWCSGTSAAPSRLIHGGLKYLETGEFRLVAESTRERNLLLRNAPHLVKPLPTVVPISSWFGGILPSAKRFFGMKAKLADRGVLIVELGLALYDWLGRKHKVMPNHRIALRARTRDRFPAMTQRAVAASTYYDARVTQAERLCFELVADGEAAHDGALALNHLALTGVAGTQVQLTDRVTGERFAIEPQLVVNAAGPWIDTVNARVGLNKDYIGGTKGSHLVLDNPDLLRALDGHMVYFGSSDGRICLAFPFFDRVLVGSTDIPADNPDDVACSDQEADYMLAMLREVFPRLSIGSDQIVFRYAGIRPLPATKADDPGDISRDHSLQRDDLPGTSIPVLSLIGGKWTTFRAFAAEASDTALSLLGRSRVTETSFVPIGGGRDFPATSAARANWLKGFAEVRGIPTARAETLLDRYGTRAGDLLPSAPETPLASLPDYSAEEIRGVIRSEQVVTLIDLVLRRLPIAVSGRLTRGAVEELADVAAAALGWGEDERNREVAALVALARERYGIELGQGIV